jgi:hypothetical protein
MEQQTPLPLSLVFGLLFYFIHLLIMTWSICCRHCLRSFILLVY